MAACVAFDQPGRRLCIALGLFTLSLIGAAHADRDFVAISHRAEGLYGPLGQGRERIDAWQNLLSARRPFSELEQLKRVNGFFNRHLRYREDDELWQQPDYWATPVESLIKGAGDCEDYAIAKYFSLRRLGIPSEKLLITYVKALSLNRAHMVLTYYASPAAEPLVLDSLMDDIEPASRRTDLLPVYAFNGEGVWLTAASGNKRAGDSKRLSRWQDVLKKMRAEGFSSEPER
ncbi:cysteine protease LapG [Pseudomonas sp. DWP3-1-2]|uniref:cysteine protease LapG n=1 Tax=Pseudomonas sp. DWP3-1-2 TaxID=2804645 RepID=UPI003CF68630